MSQGAQLCLQTRCETQDWVGICDVTLPGFGRAIVSTQKIKKDDVIVDYHGLVVEGASVAEYVERPDVKSEYCLEVAQNPRRIIDASSDSCEQHEGMRCPGRLVNHANKKIANMQMHDVQLDHLPANPRVVVFVARVDIEPFNQLRFDYGDKEARKFGKN